MKYNYHTHTFRCHHAEGRDEEFVLNAIKAGYEEIGFSDHGAWPYKDFVSSIRMTEDEIEGYVKSIRTLQEKYKDKIRIRLGFESEYFENHIAWLRETVRKYGFDYIILGQHYSHYEIGGFYTGGSTTKAEIESYRDDLLAAMDTGLYSYVAHPDLFLKEYGDFDEDAERVTREIIKKAIETDTPLEYNLLGLSRSKEAGRAGYPYPDFWRVAGEMGAKAVVGIDAHFPKDYFQEELRKEAFESLKAYGVKLTEEIRFFEKK